MTFEPRHDPAGGGAWQLATTIGSLATAGYLVTLSANYSSDGLAFARLTRSGDLFAPLFFQAEHLLYPFVGWVAASLLAAMGLRVGSLEVLQTLNALGGGIAVAAFAFAAFRLARSWAKSSGTPGLRGVSDPSGAGSGMPVPEANATARQAALKATVLAIGLAASYGWWYHASDAEDQILANAGLLVAFASLATGRGGLVGRWWPTGRGWTALAGLSFAVLIHATSVLFLPAVTILVWQNVGRREAAILVTWLALLVGLPYLVVGLGIHGIRDIPGLAGWVLAAPGQGVWGRLAIRNLWTGAASLATAVVFLPAPPGLRAPAAWFSLVAVLVVTVGMVSSVVASLRRPDRIVAVCICWAMTFVLFAAYWAPDDFQFWLLGIPPFWLLLGRALSVRWLSVFVLLIAAWNLGIGIVPRHDPTTNGGLAATRCIGDRLRPNDLVITPGWDWAGDLLPYFTEVQVLSMNDTFVLVAKGDRVAFFAELDRRIARTRSSGGRVYLVRFDDLAGDDAAFFRRVTGLSKDDFDWRRGESFTCASQSVRELIA